MNKGSPHKLTWQPGSTLARWSIWTALEGDASWLAARLRKGISSPEEIELAADLIEKKRKPRRSRSGKPTHLTNEQIAETVEYVKLFRPDWQRKRLIADVATTFRVSQKHVYNVLAKFRKHGVELPYETETIKRILARN